MGCSKNYIMYWGVFTVIIITSVNRKVCTNLIFFTLIFYPYLHLTKKPQKIFPEFYTISGFSPSFFS